MSFLSGEITFSPKRPVFTSILANTRLSKVPGISGAGPSPEKTVFTPILDAELIAQGAITSMPTTPDTPTGCPTPAVITLAMMRLTGLSPLFINAGLEHTPTIPTYDLYGRPGGDPRTEDAVVNAEALFERGKAIGSFLSSLADMLVIGECVPGGTTTALCVLRGLGYSARVSSSFIKNPHSRKEEIADAVVGRVENAGLTAPLDIVRAAGDPMMPAAAGMIAGFSGEIMLAGGTQMLAVAAVVKGLGLRLPGIATTVYIENDGSANFAETAHAIGISTVYVDPDFGAFNHAGLARYCIGEVKEGMGAGGAMYLAAAMGYAPLEIKEAVLKTVSNYS